MSDIGTSSAPLGVNLANVTTTKAVIAMFSFAL